MLDRVCTHQEAYSRDKYCPDCGVRLLSDCGACGFTSVRHYDKHCVNCGVRLEGWDDVHPQTTRRPLAQVTASAEPTPAAPATGNGNYLRGA